MSGYSATVTDHSGSVRKDYDTGKTIEVTLSVGFLVVEADGEEVFKEYCDDLKDDAETPVEAEA